MDIKPEELEHLVVEDLRRLMQEAAEKLEFERAARLRDLIAEREREN